MCKNIKKGANMKAIKDNIWEMFKKTGNISLYLAYKRLLKADGKAGNGDNKG